MARHATGMVGEKGDFQFLLIEIEREKEGIRFTLHLSDLLLLQSKEDRWNPGAGSPMGLPAGAPHGSPDRGDKGCGVCAGISDPAVV